MVDMYESVMMRRSHEHIFRSSLEFWQWFKQLAKSPEPPDHDSDEPNENPSKEGKQMEEWEFDLGAILLNYTRQLGITNRQLLLV